MLPAVLAARCNRGVEQARIIPWVVTWRCLCDETHLIPYFRHRGLVITPGFPLVLCRRFFLGGLRHDCRSSLPAREPGPLNGWLHCESFVTSAIKTIALKNNLERTEISKKEKRRLSNSTAVEWGAGAPCFTFPEGIGPVQ
jgi:hypothetical protein